MSVHRAVPCERVREWRRPAIVPTREKEARTEAANFSSNVASNERAENLLTRRWERWYTIQRDPFRKLLCHFSESKSSARLREENHGERERDGFIDYRREDENRNKFVREVGEFELKIQEVGLRINEYVSMFARGIPFHARLNLGTNIEAMARVVPTTPIACSNVRLILFRSKRTDRIECRRFINIRRSSSYTRIRF